MSVAPNSYWNTCCSSTSSRLWIRSSPGPLQSAARSIRIQVYGFRPSSELLAFYSSGTGSYRALMTTRWHQLQSGHRYFCSYWGWSASGCGPAPRCWWNQGQSCVARYPGSSHFGLRSVEWLLSLGLLVSVWKCLSHKSRALADWIFEKLWQNLVELVTTQPQWSISYQAYWGAIMHRLF